MVGHAAHLYGVVGHAAYPRLNPVGLSRFDQSHINEPIERERVNNERETKERGERVERGKMERSEPFFFFKQKTAYEI